MQQHMGQLDEEMKKREEPLYTTERERDKALDELRKMKKWAESETNMRCHGESPVHTELNSVKVLLYNANEELSTKEKLIESLKLQLEKAKGLELKLEEKEASLEKLKAELAKVKSSEAQTMALLLGNEIRVRELEAEMEKVNESGTKMFDSLISQKKTLEETQMSLEDSKLEIASLREKVKTLERSPCKTSEEQCLIEDTGHVREVIESLKSELCFAKDNLAGAKEVGKLASLKAESLIDEMDLLKNELKLATVAEETSKKALDDFALALKEVATEASQVKEELGLAKAELEHLKGEEGRLKEMLKRNEENYKRVLEEAERYKNTAERLRLEAEETSLAWSEKETGLVECLRKADEERSNAQLENNRLLDLINVAENNTRVSKEENSKLRDILKHALNEANTAKEAAEIARAENSQLKDSLAEKEEALIFLARENENYRVNEAAALENIKELKRLLYEVEKEKTHSKELKGHNRHNSVDKDQTEAKKLGKTWSLNLKDLKIPNKSDGEVEKGEIDEALGGSIFDVVDSPHPETTKHHRKKSWTFSSNGDGEQAQMEDFDGLDGTHFDDLENDRNSRKKKALLRRFGDLLIRKRAIHKKEPSE